SETMMNIECIDMPGSELTVKLSGEMDAFGCTKIRTELEQLANSKEHNLLLDLSLVTFLDSSGIGLIVFLFKRLKARERSLEMIGVQGQPQELIELLRINSVIPVSLYSESYESQDMNTCAS
ncbi:MAG: STAS domain-containing protein, partial [Gammaproteobacteria bacterium]